MRVLSALASLFAMGAGAMAMADNAYIVQCGDDPCRRVATEVEWPEAEVGKGLTLRSTPLVELTVPAGYGDAQYLNFTGPARPRKSESDLSFIYSWYSSGRPRRALSLHQWQLLERVPNRPMYAKGADVHLMTGNGLDVFYYAENRADNAGADEPVYVGVVINRGEEKPRSDRALVITATGFSRERFLAVLGSLRSVDGYY